MMRSFGSRPDCKVMDEPFYAAYLAKTGLAHPMANEIIADGEIDPAKVVAQCLTGSPLGIVYQKHMTHHMITGFDVSWISKVTNVFLIRDPARVLSSYTVKSENVTAEDIGFRKQLDLYELAVKSGEMPAVVDAHDIRQNPKVMLEKLCSAIGIAFNANMLGWPAGPRPEDGIWARHWYDAVWKSTAFAPPEIGEPSPLTGKLKAIEDEVRPYYEQMRRFRILP
jgi:hypothetical protein